MGETSHSDEECVETDIERGLRMADELEDAGVPRDRPAAALLAALPYSLRRAIINELNGEPWETVESRRNDDHWHSTRDIQAAVDEVRDRDDCRARSTEYACGLEDGSVSVADELGATSEEWPEGGWATDQTEGTCSCDAMGACDVCGGHKFENGGDD